MSKLEKAVTTRGYQVNKTARFIPFFVGLSILTSLFLITPITASGTVTLNKTFVTTPGGVVKITVDDTSLDAGIPQTDVAAGVNAAGAPTEFTIGNFNVDADLTVGDTITVFTTKVPLQDGPDADSIFNRFDVTVTAAAGTLTVFAAGAAGGSVTLQNTGGATIVAATTFTLTYTAADVQTLQVQVESTHESDGINVTLRETGATTGKFEATFGTATSSTSIKNFRDGVIDEADLLVDLDGDNSTTTENLTIGVGTLAVATTTRVIIESKGFVNAAGRAVQLDIDGDGEVSTTPIAFFATSTFDETKAGVDTDEDGAADITGIDLNGDGDATDTAVLATEIVDVTMTVDETVAQVDFDGDGEMDVTGVDLNNDGDANDPLVQRINVGALPESPDRPTIGVLHAAGGVITVKHTDAQATVTVEVTDPDVSITSPADAAATQIQTTRISVEVTDTDSGIDSDTIVFDIISATDAGGAAVIGIETTDVGTPTAIASGFLAEAQLVGVPEGETNIEYEVTVADKAGNTGSAKQTLKIDTTAPAFAANRINPDKSVVTNAGAETGHYWDPDALDGDGEIVTVSTSTKNTSIAVYFNEDLDGSSISRLDFEVDIGGAKSAPALAEWFAGAPSVVFLTVPEMAADTKPKINVVDSIADKAGNPVASIVMADGADDGVAPTIAVTVSPDSLLSTKEVSISISANERLLTTPTVTVKTVNDNEAVKLLVSSLGSNAYSATLSTDTADKYDLKVEGRDTAGNVQIVDGGDIEIDNALPHPTTEPVSNDDTSATAAAVKTTFTGSPLFLEIDWTGEGAEYGAGADDDTHDDVTLTSVTLDGTDVSGSVSKEATAQYIVALGELAVGDYTIALSGEDEVGNTKDETIEFSVAVRPKFRVPLTTGWNLISFPGRPEDTSITDVIPADHPIDVVMAYDPKGQGGWLVNTKGDDGLFATEGINILTNLDGKTAYWVRTDSFEDLEVTIPGVRGGTATLLPALSLAKGWNLLPILDVSGAPATTTISEVAYLGGLGGVSRIYEYNTRRDQFDPLPTNVGGAPFFTYGKGYWIYLTAAGVLVP